jgi:hypothetical protein
VLVLQPSTQDQKEQGYYIGSQSSLEYDEQINS